MIANSLTGYGADPERAANAKCLSVPLAVVRGTDVAHPEADFGMLVIFRADFACAGSVGSADDLGPVTQGMLRVLSAFGQPVTDNAMRYQLDGHPASFVQGSASAKMLGEGKMVHAGATCTLLKQNAVRWLILGSDYKAMPALIADTVSLDGHAPVPLVPKTIVQPW